MYSVGVGKAQEWEVKLILSYQKSKGDKINV